MFLRCPAGSQKCGLIQIPRSVRANHSFSCFLIDSFFVFAWTVTEDQANKQGQNMFSMHSVLDLVTLGLRKHS